MSDSSEHYQYDGLYDDVPGTVRARPHPDTEIFEPGFAVSDRAWSVILNIVGILAVAGIIVGILTTP